MKDQKYPCYTGANRHHTLGGVHIECLPCPIPHDCPPSILNPFLLFDYEYRDEYVRSNWLNFWESLACVTCASNNGYGAPNWDSFVCYYCSDELSVKGHGGNEQKTK